MIDRQLRADLVVLRLQRAYLAVKRLNGSYGLFVIFGIWCRGGLAPKK